MANTLQARGAILETLAVYQRECAPFCLEAWRAFTHANNPILLLTSWESFECLQRHLQRHESGEVYQKAPWDFLTATVVFGQRIADHLQQIGWQGAIEVCAPSQFAIVTAVESILERQNK
jgi:uroporphyrinogen-III synthase